MLFAYSNHPSDILLNMAIPSGLSAGLSDLLWVAMGGALGASCRFGIISFSSRYSPSFPAGTLIANLLGCFFAGLVLSLLLHHQSLPTAFKLFILTGFLGSLTTFSAFGVETLSLSLQSKPLWAGLNILFNFTGTLMAVLLGKALMDLFLQK